MLQSELSDDKDSSESEIIEEESEDDCKSRVIDATAALDQTGKQRPTWQWLLLTLRLPWELNNDWIRQSNNLKTYTQTTDCVNKKQSKFDYSSLHKSAHIHGVCVANL